jgi:hypothetical protein
VCHFRNCETRDAQAGTHDEVRDAARAAARVARLAHLHVERVLWERQREGGLDERGRTDGTAKGNTEARRASASEAALLRAMAGISSRRTSISSCVVAKLTCSGGEKRVRVRDKGAEASDL